MGRAGTIHDHPALGHLAVCKKGRIGRVEKVVERPNKRKLYMGHRIVDNEPWEAVSPVFLAMVESCWISGSSRTLPERIREKKVDDGS